MIVLRFLGAVVLLLVGLVGLGYISPVLAATYTVSITGTQFIPSTLKIAPGDSISFINTTDSTQSARTTLTSGFNTGNIGPGQSKLITVVNTGTFAYSSQYNSSLSGTVEVASPSASPTPVATSSTKGQVATTQQQPVSGVEDVLYAVVTAGLVSIGIGLYWQHRANHESAVVDLPPVSVQSTQDE